MLAQRMSKYYYTIIPLKENDLSPKKIRFLDLMTWTGFVIVYPLDILPAHPDGIPQLQIEFLFIALAIVWFSSRVSPRCRSRRWTDKACLSDWPGKGGVRGEEV